MWRATEFQQIGDRDTNALPCLDTPVLTMNGAAMMTDMTSEPARERRGMVSVLVAALKVLALVKGKQIDN